jgi:uncharacterized protein DUF6789
MTPATAFGGATARNIPSIGADRLALRLLLFDAMVAKYRTEVNRALLGGVVAGVLAGIILSIILLLIMTGHGADPWMALKGAGAPFLRERAHQPGWDAGAVIVGVLSHLAVSVVWGVLFALVVYGFSRTATVISGVPFGLAVWIGMHYILLPLLGIPGGNQSPVQALALHVIFGLAVAVAFLPYQSSVPRTEMHDRGTGAPIQGPV